ncbi:hypothetical protein RIF29_27208 [Crotalaria pallida]|uniref:Uncharacterized protein n=1 Tax=Crotalaria pallida TaxID=3830 RepID=A0AAN9ENN6_CROPI
MLRPNRRESSASWEDDLILIPAPSGNADVLSSSSSQSPMSKTITEKHYDHRISQNIESAPIAEVYGSVVFTFNSSANI